MIMVMALNKIMRKPSIGIAKPQNKDMPRLKTTSEYVMKMVKA